MFGSWKSQPSDASLKTAAAPAAAGLAPPAPDGAPAAGISAGQPGAASPQAAEAAGQRNQLAERQAVAFAQIVSMMARSARHKHYSIADLEWLVVPPLILGQIALTEAKLQNDGGAITAALVLWASVSPEVDKRLSENLSAPIRLRPDEWRSGEILWLVDTIGDSRIIPALVKQLATTAWQGRNVKVRAVNESGQPVAAEVTPSQLVT